MHALYFACAPTGPEQSSCLLTGEPPGASCAALWQRYLYRATMEAFRGMMSNRSPEVFKVTPGASGAPAFLYVPPTLLAGDI
jgi:hypothetical protein